MCIPSKQIKLCTCTRKSIKKLPHYWLLKRYNENKDLRIIGEAILPELHEDYYITVQSLLQRLNESDVFDRKIDFIDKDRLEIVLHNLKTPDERMTFYFQYFGGFWMKSVNYPFDKNQYQKIVSGEVEIEK